MKKIALLLMVACCLTGSINAQTRRSSKVANKSKNVATGTFSMNSAKWSKAVNLNQDISKMSYQELYYLRALVYATHGRWFTDGEVAQMLNSKASWYNDMVYKRLEAFYKRTNNKFTDAQFKNFQAGTALSQQEKAFVTKIEQRMKAIKTATMDGRNMESPQLCVNMCQLEKPSQDMLDKLDKYNFAIEQSTCEQLFNIYEQNDYNEMPSFITTDTYLQVAHMYLSYVQKQIEQNYFTTALANTLTAIYNQAMADASTCTGDVKDRSEFVATYAAVGVKLLTEKDLQIPATYQNAYNAELQLISAGVDDASPLLQTQLFFNYSLFRPRGHYTRSEEQKRYFMAMMWTQTARFESKDANSFKRAFALAETYNRLSESQRSEFEHMGDVITQLTGESDNVSILQMAKYIKQQGINELSSIDDEATYNAVFNETKRLNDSQNKLSSKAEELSGFYVNMMPQRFLVDNDILRQMVDETPNAELAYPRGLHVFEAFGSKSADDLVYNFYGDDKKWDGFNKTMNLLKGKYADKPVGMGTIYDQRLQILVDMSKDHSSKLDFAFYNTTDWQKKELNTALASWATLKHDAVLYAEQPMVAECGGGEELPPPMPMLFIEPNTKFWHELSDIISDTKSWLEKSNYLNDELKEKSDNLIGSINRCRDIADKEAQGTIPSYDDRYELQKIGSTLEWITLGLIDPSLTLNSWDDIKGADRSIAQIADIFTRNVQTPEKCKKNGVLYSACGNANVIYVLVKLGDRTYLTRGATYGYYEFVQPVNQPRLTDEEWQKQQENDTFSMPEWMKPYILNSKSKPNERDFYGSGC